MQIKYRKLNKNECYACSVKDIKEVIQNDEQLHVRFGSLGRDYRFDSKHIKRPHIEGAIISSFQKNRRLGMEEHEPILCFYAIKDERYDDKYREAFKHSILPKVMNWYREVNEKQTTAIPGVEELLVEWADTKFKIHQCRFK